MGRPRKGTSSEPKSKVKTIQGYIIKEDKPAVDEELFSDEDDDFDFAGNSVKKVPLHKTKGQSILCEHDVTCGVPQYTFSV